VSAFQDKSQQQMHESSRELAANKDSSFYVDGKRRRPSECLLERPRRQGARGAPKFSGLRLPAGRLGRPEGFRPRPRG
jgi:hypothetical protein